MLHKHKARVKATVVKTCISPGQAEDMHREQLEVQRESSDESTCHRNGLGLAGACRFDFRWLIFVLVRRGRDTTMSIRGPRVKQEGLPRLRVQTHGAEP